MAKVSVIVPVYNVEKYISRCLKSLINQTLEDIEIIIVNDGATDCSESVILDYIKNYPDKIKYFKKENGGLSSARNYGMKYAKGEYIAFLDSDDYVEKDMYKEMYKLAVEENADMVECDFLWEWEIEKKSEIKKDTRRSYKSKREMMKKPRVVAWNKLIKRNIIEENHVKFPEGLIYEDLEFFYKIIPYINKIAYINKYFVHYIQRQNSISNYQTDKNADIFKILDNIKNFYNEKGIYEKYNIELKYMRKRILLGSSLKRILKIKDKKLRIKLFIKTLKNLQSNPKSKIESNENSLSKETDTYGNKRFLLKETDTYGNKRFLLKETDNDGNKKFLPKQTDTNWKKICFGITRLGIGGAERVLVDLANELINQYDITIFTIYGGGELEKELNSKIRLISMYENEKKNFIIPLYIFIFGKKIYIKFLKNKFDVEIAFLEGPITRIFSYGKNKSEKLYKNIDKSLNKIKEERKVKKIAWVHNDIAKVFGTSIKSKIKNYIDKYFYKKYDNIIFVSNQNKISFESMYGNISDYQVIYNYIDKNRVINKSLYKKEMVPIEYAPKSNDPKVTCITVSRLVKQKGIDRLIRVHKRLIDDGLIHTLYIIGDGKEKGNLLKLIQKLNVQNTVIFLGKLENPYPYIKNADYFLLLSYFEGYGMVIEEAKILNKPIIITNTAAKEAVQNYKKSLVIKNDEESIFCELKNVLQEKYENLYENSKKYNYDNHHLLNQVMKLIES